MKLCDACNMNAVTEPKARRCPSCQVATAKLAARIAVYKHRERVRRGKARSNRTYAGRPTTSAIQNAIEVLRESGVLQ